MIKFGQKRPYLSDKKPFNSVFGVSNVSTQVMTAMMLASLPSLTRYNLYLAEANKKLDRGEHVEDFDSQSEINLMIPQFGYHFFRNYTISFFKKGLEELSVIFLSPQLADKLCKDIPKSFSRKLARFNRIYACGKVVSTSVLGNLLFATSSFLYDVLEEIYHMIFDAKRKKSSIKELLVFIVKKMSCYSIQTIAGALGLALGGLINHPTASWFGGMIGQATGVVIANNLIKF